MTKESISHLDKNLLLRVTGNSFAELAKQGATVAEVTLDNGVMTFADSTSQEVQFTEGSPVIFRRASGSTRIRFRTSTTDDTQVLWSFENSADSSDYMYASLKSDGTIQIDVGNGSVDRDWETKLQST